MDRPLNPDEWIDDLEWDALHPDPDVEDVMRRVSELQAKEEVEAIRKATLN